MADKTGRIRTLRRGLIPASVSLGMTILLAPEMAQLRLASPFFPGSYIVFIFLGECYTIAFFLWQIRRLHHEIVTRYLETAIQGKFPRRPVFRRQSAKSRK
jgi:hypothetical protein